VEREEPTRGHSRRGAWGGCFRAIQAVEPTALRRGLARGRHDFHQEEEEEISFTRGSSCRRRKIRARIC
jgi:hypothetical protein